MLLAILGAVAFTLAPAMGAWRLEVMPALKAGEGSVVRGSSRFADKLVIAQLALSVVLLTVCGLAAQSLFYIDTSDLYFTQDHLLLADINTNGAAPGRFSNRC